MSKALEAFKIVYNNFDYLISDVCIENDDVNICLKTIKEQLPTIKRALHRLEAIDNASPSQALKDLEILKSHISARDMLSETNKKIALDICNDVEKALLKAQEQELHNGGRLPNKEILYLKQSLEQCNDKPIFYVSRTYGNKYIVPQKFLDDLTKENVELKKKARALEIIKEKRVACDLLTNPDVMDYKKYNSHCDKYDFIVPLTEEEFNLLKEVLE